MKSVIIEGPDHLGKTTLAKRLADEHGLHYRHITKPSNWSDFTNTLEQSLLETFLCDPHVFDRHFLGSFVYGLLAGLHPVPSDWNRERLTYYGRLCKFLDVRLVVVFCADDEVYRRRLNTNPKEELFDIEQMVAANRGFRVLGTYLNHLGLCELVPIHNHVDWPTLNYGDS